MKQSSLIKNPTSAQGLSMGCQIFGMFFPSFHGLNGKNQETNWIQVNGQLNNAWVPV